MKKQLLTVLLSFVAMIAVNTKSNAQSLIHYWNFNNGVTGTAGAMYTPTINAIPADYTDLPGSNARILYAEMPGVSAAYHTYIDYYAAAATENDILNAQMGATSGNAIKVRNPSDSMYLMFYIPTTHFRNIVLKYATEVSSYASGQLQQIFDYSIDSGANWRTSGLSEPLDSGSATFRLVTVNFTADSAAVNNNSKFVFRIHFNLPNDTAGHTDPTGATASGNNRFDNITVQGDSIGGTAVDHSVVAVIANAAQHYTLYPNPVVNTLDINAEADGAKSITIYNELGQSVFSGVKQGKNFSINASQFSVGNYYIDIRENATGAVSTMKFTKQ